MDRIKARETYKESIVLLENLKLIAYCASETGIDYKMFYC